MMSVIGCMIAFLLPYFKCMISKEKKKKHVMCEVFSVKGNTLLSPLPAPGRISLSSRVR
jgi:hypothetical protein